MYVRPKIFLFGDSITQYSFGGTLKLSNAVTTTRFGWGSLLSAAYARKADVYNKGFSGYNTRMALERELVPKLFGKGIGGDHDPSSSSLAFCTVFFGANDATLPPNPNNSATHTQHVPKDEYVENLRKIIKSIRSETNNSKLPIIIITPPPVHDEKWKKSVGAFDHHNRSNEVAREYGLAAIAVASEFDEKCYVVDAWEVLKGDEGTDVYGKYMADGLHLTEDGNQVLYDGIMKLIQTEMKHLAPAADDDKDSEGMKLQEPEWQELC